MGGETENPKIDWRGTTPYALQFDDLYYSADDPVGEVRHTFLDGTDFDNLCWQDTLCIAETGFGTGLNFLEAWSRWEELAPTGALLDFISVEAYPLETRDLARAHETFPQHRKKSETLRRAWPGAIPGIHRIRLAEGRVRLILIVGNVADVLPVMDFQADAWFLDGFAPAKNPDMWRNEVLSELARLSRPEAKLATFTAAGAVRRGLMEAGFDVTKRPGFGRKRDCLHARYPAHQMPPPPSRPWTARPSPLPRPARIAVIGAGIAGRAIARRLRETGRNVAVLAGPESRAYAASTLPLALIAPKLVRGSQAFPLFWRQAFHDSLREIEGLDHEITADAPSLWQGARGLVIPALSPEKAEAQAKLLQELSWPDGEACSIPGDEASERSGLSLSGGLYIGAAGTIDGQALLAALSDGPDIDRDVSEIQRQGSLWQLYDRKRNILCEADAVILACGPGITRFLAPNSDRFGLRVGAGQMITAHPDRPVTAAVLGNGYISSSGPEGRITIGATSQAHAPLAPVPPDPAKTAHILARQETPLGGRQLDDVIPWTGLRCDTGDHLPLVGPIQDFSAFERNYEGLRVGKKAETLPQAVHLPGLFALSALGARGFQGAFLAADLIASYLDGRPYPVSAPVAEALLPARFQIRDLIRNK